jgi:hypothetical protein
MVYVKPKQRKTKELEFLYRFKETDFFDSYIDDNKEDNHTFIEEPYTGFGYPDLVFLTWNKNIAELWTEERNKLTLTDIKVIQHLYNCNIEKSIHEISVELGYSEHQLSSVLLRLFEAKIVIETDEMWTLRELENIFFLETIITIEAKLKNWRQALLQASNSEYFSSEVFNLYPKNLINENLVKEYKSASIGIISFDRNYNIVKPANRRNLPITINGWLFNELIGRSLWQRN